MSAGHRTFLVKDIDGVESRFEADGGIFDFDGTVAHGWEELLEKTQEAIFMELGFVCPPHTLLKGKLPHEVRKIMQAAQPGPGRQEDFDLAWGEIFRRFCARVDKTLEHPDFTLSLYPDTTGFLNRLGSLPRGIATNSGKPIFGRKKDRTPGLSELGFGTERTLNCVSRGKPDPEMLHAVQSALGLSRPFMAGDTMSDALAGHRAGYTTLIAARDRAHEELRPFQTLSGVHVVWSFDDVRLTD